MFTGAPTNNATESLAGCNFYFEAENIQNKLVMEISGLSVESPVAGGNQAIGSGTGNVKARQATPTTEKYENVIIKIVASADIDLYTWYQQSNNNGSGSSNWAASRKAASISAFDQAGTRRARWEIRNSYPCKYEGPSFKVGDGGELANETITLVHEGITRVE
ncbi:MAG: phage tail protein [Prochloraceae cyanobacterium]